MKWLPSILILLLGGFWGWRLHLAKLEVTAEISRLKPMVEETAGLAARPSTNDPSRSVDPRESDRLRRDHQELLRLRSEIAGLRQRSRFGGEALEQRIRDVQAETLAAERETELIAARKQAAETSKEIIGSLNLYAHIVKETARSSGVSALRSWEEVEQALQRSWVPMEKRTLDRTQRIQRSLQKMLTQAMTSSIPLSAFEF